MKDTIELEKPQQALLSNQAEKLVYQLKAAMHSDSAIFQGVSSVESFEYMDQVTSLMKKVFKDDDDAAHTQLVQLLDAHSNFAQKFVDNAVLYQQLMELFYGVQLLLAQRKPVNNLESVQKVLFTSSQHQFDLPALIAWINANEGAFVNSVTKTVFNKKDCQLIKLAAEHYGLNIVSKNNQTAEGAVRMQQLGLTEVPLTVSSRYGSESSRVFNAERIYHACRRAFLHVYQDSMQNNDQHQDGLDRVTIKVVQRLSQGAKAKGQSSVDIEQIQTVVESVLMDLGFHDIARSYVLYREEKNKLRQQRIRQLQIQLEGKPEQTKTEKSLLVAMDDGTTVRFTESDLLPLVHKFFADYQHLSPQKVLQDAFEAAFEGITMEAINEALTMSARMLIEQQPDYSFVAARILKKRLFDGAYPYLIDKRLSLVEYPEDYSELLTPFITKGIKQGLLNKELEKFDLAKLSAALECDRDDQFTYLGLQTLYDRYFLHDNQVRYELPQIFFMRVAMGLSLEEKDRDNKAIEYYQLLSSFDYMSSTPTLFNSGLIRSQLSSCYLTTVPDDLHGIYASIQDNAMLSKFAGGLGNDWTPVRGTGSKIKGTNGISSGIVPFLNVADATAIAVNQGGKRKGAVCAYLEVWHIDMLDFVELRKNTGDDRRRTHDMNTASWIPDLFMQRVMEKGQWTLFSPDDTPELHDLYGAAFKEKYQEYERLAEKNGMLHKKIEAISLWRKMLSMLFETGHPWMTFKDPCNIRSPQQHCGVVHSSNLCTEITLNTSKDEIAVCNLGSVNLAQHIVDGVLDVKKLERTINTAVRMLDNVIDINYYAVEAAENSNLRHRPVGLGMMGFQDALYKLGISYESDAAVEFADVSAELISYYAIKASSLLAKERGAYKSYDGSLWSRGILPIDSIAMLRKERGEQYLMQDQDARLDWQEVRDLIKKHGMRNSNVLAIAPTATIANICGVTQSIEPTYKNLFVKSNLSGEFTVVNPSLVKDLQGLQLWDQPMVHALKLSNGSVQNIDRIPENIRAKYKTAFEVDISYIVRAAAKRAKWLDQSQSLNLYMPVASGKKLDALYKQAWLSGLKTCYYLRSLGATDSEKSSVSDGALNAVSVHSAAAKVCSIDNPDCEACQ